MSKFVVTTLLLSAFGLAFSATADARGRGRCGCCESNGTYYTAQASDGSRLYSYEPGSGYYVSPRASSRTTPLYLLPKSDPGKYDVR